MIRAGGVIYKTFGLSRVLTCLAKKPGPLILDYFRRSPYISNQAYSESHGVLRALHNTK